ncbi:hypothetical protein V5O48_019404, partial [Marasmius crinis-equi]
MQDLQKEHQQLENELEASEEARATNEQQQTRLSKSLQETIGKLQQEKKGLQDRLADAAETDQVQARKVEGAAAAHLKEKSDLVAEKTNLQARLSAAEEQIVLFRLNQQREKPP